MNENQALRVALVWNGTVMQEKTFRLPSDSIRITVGEERSNTFVLSGSGVPRRHTLFKKEHEGYSLDLLRGMTGKLTVQDDEISVEEKVGRSIDVVPGDSGVIHLHDISLYFQFVDPPTPFAGRGVFASAQGILLTTIWFSFLIQVVFVFVCRLMWDEELARERFVIDDRFVRIIAAPPPEEVIDAEEEEAMDDTTSQRAGGEEGEFGEEDALEEESVLPDHDGPLVDEIPTTELGQAFEQAIGQSGELARMFDPNTLDYGFGTDFATAGEGDAYIVGRGSGGLGMRGTGRGGGGQGFGRAHGVGNIDTGGGRGVSANLGRRSQREPEPRVDRGTPRINGFLSREQIERVVRRHQRGIRYCYERELQDDSELEGQITVNWTIDLDGTVSRRSIEENTMGNRDVESCILREVGRMRFPEPDGGMVVVRYPFTFRNAADDE